MSIKTMKKSILYAGLMIGLSSLAVQAETVLLP